MIRNIIVYVILGAYVMGGGFLMRSSIEITEDQTGNVGSYILGDVDGDGKVTTNDAKLIMRASVGLEELSVNKAMFERADYDGDGKITIADVRATLRASTEMEPIVLVNSPDEPGPEPETDNKGLAEIPDDELDKVIDSIATPFGTIAIFSDDRAAVCNNKSLIACWSVETTADDILIDAYSFNPNSPFRYLGIIGDDIYHFSNAGMLCERRDIDHYSYTGTEWYCFFMIGSTLYAWSPGIIAHIADNVTAVTTYCGYTFYEEGYFSVSVMNADPYRIQHMSQEYINAHPIEGSTLGAASIDYYASELGSDPNVIDYSKREEFNRTHNFYTFDEWGHPRSDIDVGDFEEFAWLNYDDIYKQFNIPTVKTAETMVFDHVKFNGKDGYIYIAFKNNMIDFVRWTGYNSSMDLYNEQLSYLRTFGADGDVRYPRQGQIEQGVVIMGRTIYAGYDSNAGGQGTYILVPYQ